MAEPDLALYAFLRLAAISQERCQWLPRNKFLVLAGEAACRNGRLPIAERCRSLVMEHSHAHLIGRYETFAAAMKSTEFQVYFKQLKKFCSVERAEFLLSAQGEEYQEFSEAAALRCLDNMTTSFKQQADE